MGVEQELARTERDTPIDEAARGGLFAPFGSERRLMIGLFDARAKTYTRSSSAEFNPDPAFQEATKVALFGSIALHLSPPTFDDPWSQLCRYRQLRQHSRQKAAAEST